MDAKDIRYKPTPLPPLSTTFGIPTVDSAYNLCFHEQHRLLKANLQLTSPQVVRIGVLGWIFHFAPQRAILARLSTAIFSCQNDPETYGKLGQFFIDFWIRIFRKYKGRTPGDTGHTSRPSFDNIVDQVTKKLEPYPKNKEDAKQNALLRDGFRCVISGAYDEPSCEKNAELNNRVMQDRAIVASTQLAHIICESTNLNLTATKKENYAATAGAVLELFGYEKLFKETNGAGIHRLENLLTLTNDIHDRFDVLALWLEPVNPASDDHRYKVGVRNPVFYHNLPREVTLVSHSPIVDNKRALAMPSKDYLALHAACAKVARMSGAAELLDLVDDARGDGDALSPDGSSALILDQVLWAEMLKQETQSPPISIS